MTDVLLIDATDFIALVAQTCHHPVIYIGTSITGLDKPDLPNYLY
jgi:hypothetical protein